MSEIETKFEKRVNRQNVFRELLFDPRWTGGALAVALIITEFSHWPDGTNVDIRPSTLARQVKLSEEYVAEIIRRLQRDGYLIIEGDRCRLDLPNWYPDDIESVD